MTTTDLELIAPEARSMPDEVPAPPPRELTVIEHAVRSGATPEQLQALLELQVRADNHQLEMMREKRRMAEEDRKAAAVVAFRRDFAAFRGENIIIAKNKLVDRGRAGSFMQAEYHSVTEKLSPALSRHGFSFRHDQNFGVRTWKPADGTEAQLGWVTVTCFLEHKDGHFEVLTLEGPEGDQSANTTVQNMQLTASYLKRQALLAITGTATGGEDDEGRMRPRKSADADNNATVDESVLQAGREAAMNGMADLTKWWGALTSKQRSEHNKDFPQLRRAAQQADQGANN